MMETFQSRASFIWQVADDILRGTFKAHEYGGVILPFVVLRRLDCVLKPHKDAVLRAQVQFQDKLPEEERLAPILYQAAGGRKFYNASSYDLERLAQDAANIELNFNQYLAGFSPNVREIIEHFSLPQTVRKLADNKVLFMLVDKFTEIDLSPDEVPNHEMGYIFEELLRRFSEMSNETAGEHYTPREVIRLMVNLLFAEHLDTLHGKGIIRSVFDPACGTGGMLITAKEHIQAEVNPDVEIRMYGQELNDQTYAIAKSDVLIMGEDADNIRLGNSFTRDRFRGETFHFMLCNPPFGVSWKREQAFIENEAGDPHGRFHAGTPRSSDGALLFLQHMLSKMKPEGSRIAIIFNGSPLFTGDAGSGESNIRRWIIENDWLEAIVAMPTELFYNTGIATYIWIVTNRKPQRRQGKVQLINAVHFYAKMRRSLGNKRSYFTDAHIAQITDLYTAFAEGDHVRVFDNQELGYTKVTVERPLLEDGQAVTDKPRVKMRDRRGNPRPDPSLRDYERVPLKEDIEAYFRREVLPYVPDAWMDRDKDRVGYEINFNRYFFEYTPPRPLEDIQRDILALEDETQDLLRGILDR
jgi:type I restriction enzyme M protein